MSNNPKQFPLDLTGKAARNLIRNEERTFNSRNDRIFVPSGGVFYSHTVVMFDKTTGKRLQPITDYKCLHIHEEASIASGLPTCCVILVTNDTIQAVKFDYQVIGGQYSDNLPALRQLLDGVDFQSLTRISWGTQIYGKPETFPAAAHRHPGSEFGDWKRFHVALNNIYHALLHKDTAAWQSVYEYINATINALGVSDISNTYFTKDEVATQIVNALGAYTTTTEMTKQLTTMTKKVDDSAADLVKLITAQATTIDQVSASLADFMKIDQLKVSPDSGNLIEKRANGLYYGIQAPADLTNLYVDAVGGNDKNPGTKALPFKTLQKALDMSPTNLTNTIWLRCIPEEHREDIAYTVGKQYTIDGCTRTIRIYDDPRVDGDIYQEIYNLSNRDYTRESDVLINRPAVRVKWYRTMLGTLEYYSCRCFFITNNGRLNVTNVDFFLEQLDEDKPSHSWTEYTAVFFCNRGEFYQVSSGFYRIVRDHDIVDWGVSRPVDVTNTIYDPRWNRGFWSWSNRNVTVALFTTNVTLGYAGGMNGAKTLTGRPKIAKVFDPLFAPVGSDASLVMDIQRYQESFVPLFDTTSIKVNVMENYVRGTEFIARGMKRHPSNIVNMLCRSRGFWGVVYTNGVCTNVLSNVIPFDYNTSIGNSQNRTFMNNSIYSQPYKPGDIYQTTMSFRSSAEVAEVMGYGHWVRWGEGRVLVGMGSYGNADPIGMPDSMFVPYGTDGEYSHTLTIAEIPSHSHRFVSDDSVEGNKEFVRVALSGTADFSQRDASGEARIYRTPTKYPDESGGGQPHNNIQPFVTVDRWKRHVSSDGFYFTELVFARNTFEFNAGLNIQEWTDVNTLALSGLTLSRPNADWSIIAIKAEKPHADGQGTLTVRLQINRTDILANHMLFVDVANDAHVWKKPMSHPRWGWQRTISSEGIIEIVYAYRSMLPVETQPGDTQTLPDGTVITVNVRQNARYRMVVQAATRIAFYKK